MWWLSYALMAWADPVAAEGIAQWHGDLADLESGVGTLQLRNPHLCRSRLWVGEVALGLVNPRAEVRLHDVRPGPWHVRWETAAGFVRHQTVSATAPEPPATPPSPEESPRTSER
ncbi:MAG: hypothetical protein KTR31_08065 [Myxococcales bacterium]|nr:hypothetical protein [Myxococcales bacterium]